MTAHIAAMSELLQLDDAIDPDVPNEIDVSRMVKNRLPNNDFTNGGPQHSNYAYGKYSTNSTTFSATMSVERGKALSVPR